MAKTSMNIRDISPNDVLFVTVNHTDGTIHIGTNFTELGRKVVLSPEEAGAVMEFLKDTIE